MFLQLLV